MKVYVSSTSLSVFSMIGVCVSSVFYVLLCVASLSQCKDWMYVYMYVDVSSVLYGCKVSLGTKSKDDKYIPNTRSAKA